MIYYSYEASDIGRKEILSCYFCARKEGKHIWEIFITIKKVGKTIGEIVFKF